MRYPVEGANGFKCDECGCLISPKKALHIKTLILDPDEEKAGTGYTKVIATCDLCKKCYLNSDIIQIMRHCKGRRVKSE